MADGARRDDGPLPVGGWERGHDPGAVDGSAARVGRARSLGVVASPAGWRLLGERLEGLRSRRPRRRGASGENGGARCRDSSRCRSSEVLVAAAVWETLPPERQREVTLRLARLLARLVEAERDE